MKEESVSVREFERWASLQADIQNKHSDQLQEISKEIRNTNELLREDIATTKNLVKDHISQYNHDKERNLKTFIEINSRMENTEDILKEREGVYNIVNKIKWGAVIVISGSLAAFGKDLAMWMLK